MRGRLAVLLFCLIIPASSPAADDAEALFQKALDQLLKTGSQGDTSAAERYLQAVLEQQPNHIEAMWQMVHIKLASLLNAPVGERSTGLLLIGPHFAEVAKRAKQLNKQSFLHYATAVYASYYKAYERALAEIDKALALEPQSSRYLFKKAQLSIDYGEWVKRDDEVEKGIRLVRQAKDLAKVHPNRFVRDADYDFTIAWGTASLSKPRWNEVAEHYRRYIEHSEISASYAFAWNNLSVAYRKLGQCDKSKEAAENALKVMKFGAAQSNKRYAEFCMEMQGTRLKSIEKTSAGAVGAGDGEKKVPQQSLEKPAPTNREALVREVLELSGAKQQFDHYPKLFKDQLAQRRDGIDAKAFRQLEKIFAETFTAETFHRSAVQALHNHYDEKRMAELLQFLRSPLSRKISQLEVKSSAPEAALEIRKFAAGLRERQPAKDRVALIQRLDKAIGATETAIEIVLVFPREMARGAYLALSPAERAKQGPLEKQLEPLLKEARGQIEGPIKTSLLVNYLFTYQTLPEQDLAKYVGFYETEAGRWFSRGVTEGIKNAMASGSEKLGKEILALGSELRKSAAAPKPDDRPRYFAAGKRNPFRPLALQAKANQRRRENLSPLERYEIGQLKLVAIVWDTQEPIAMVEDSAGLGYTIKVGSLIGANEGKVRAIKPNEVIIDETQVDFYGERKNQAISMKLPQE